jgi:hypothetical protein
MKIAEKETAIMAIINARLILAGPGFFSMFFQDNL